MKIRYIKDTQTVNGLVKAGDVVFHPDGVWACRFGVAVPADEHWHELWIQHCEANRLPLPGPFKPAEPEVTEDKKEPSATGEPPGALAASAAIENQPHEFKEAT